ncbi:MAG: transketolase [Propionibacteriaceae bacterium]|nr:transketolase [Propionibacteriaceae bacterium]
MMADTSQWDHVVTDTLGRIGKDAPREEVVAFLRHAATELRRRDPIMIVHSGNGHIGGDFSIADILVTLVLHELNLDPADPLASDRDRLILSKGHTAGALYIAMALAGYFPTEELMTFMDPGSRLNGHPNRNYIPGIETNTGALGHGLPVGVGTALAAKMDGSDRRTVVLLGDGELQEGSNWEALMAGAQFELDHLYAVVDRNRLQMGSRTEDAVGLEPLAEKFTAFGWRVVEIDAHDYDAILDAFAAEPEPGRPTLILAHSHKGHPISFMSDQVGWHHHVPTPDEVDGILAELDELEAAK